MTTETRKGKGGSSIRPHLRSKAGAMRGGAHSGRPQHWETKEGSADALGATWIAEEQAYNFALYSKYAESVTLLLYVPTDLVTPVFTYQFDHFKNKTGRVWHARILRSQMQSARYYAFAIDGPPASGDRFERHAFNPNKVLLDPYAKSVFFPPGFDRMAALGTGSNVGKAPLGVICEEDLDFDWGDDPRPRHDSDLIIYEMHVRGFTMNPNSGMNAEKRGTFAGVIEKIPYLRKLGITAVELMPVFQFDASEPNYWGYMPLSFFAPHDRYSTQHRMGEQIREFRQMVKALHRAGIEVILDVVYNHTGEGDEHGPIFSFKGIDNSTYYMASKDPDHPYADFTGTGNTLHCANRAVRQLVIDSLRYWTREMHVDGFRFDLASVFSRKSDGSINLDDPPIFGDIAADVDLARVRMIAEPWEGNVNTPNYELGFGGSEMNARQNKCCPMCGMHECGCSEITAALQRSFPGIGWRQWNDKFRATIRHFAKSDSGFVSDLMTRIYGSSDVFPDSLQEASRPFQSLNYISSHDGLTLYDMVSYNSADSWNCGERDGEKDVDADVMRLRKSQVKNFVCLLLLSNGTPMFRAGDEFLQTQGGDGNPYNIDSPTTWLDWRRLEAHGDIFRFFQKMIEFRKSHPSVARSVFWRDDVKWYGVGKDVDWSYESHSLAYCLHGDSENDGDLYVMINAYCQPLTFRIQEGNSSEWKRIIDTNMDSPDDIADPSTASALSSLDYQVQPRSVVVLLRP
jgi:isoamylase